MEDTEVATGEDMGTTMEEVMGVIMVAVTVVAMVADTEVEATKLPPNSSSNNLQILTVIGSSILQLEIAILVVAQQFLHSFKLFLLFISYIVLEMTR